jgi:hypothetical protein
LGAIFAVAGFLSVHQFFTGSALSFLIAVPLMILSMDIKIGVKLSYPQDDAEENILDPLNRGNRIRQKLF